MVSTATARVEAPETGTPAWDPEPTREPAAPPAIRDFPAEERPRERLRAYGAGQLTNAELIAILLRIGGRGENVSRSTLP